MQYKVEFFTRATFGDENIGDDISYMDYEEYESIALFRQIVKVLVLDFSETGPQ